MTSTIEIRDAILSRLGEYPSVANVYRYFPDERVPSFPSFVVLTRNLATSSANSWGQKNKVRLFDVKFLYALRLDNTYVAETAAYDAVITALDTVGTFFDESDTLKVGAGQALAVDLRFISDDGPEIVNHEHNGGNASTYWGASFTIAVEYTVNINR